MVTFSNWKKTYFGYIVIINVLNESRWSHIVRAYLIFHYQNCTLYKPECKTRWPNSQFNISFPVLEPPCMMFMKLNAFSPFYSIGCLLPWKCTQQTGLSVGRKGRTVWQIGLRELGLTRAPYYTLCPFAEGSAPRRWDSNMISDLHILLAPEGVTKWVGDP